METTPDTISQFEAFIKEASDVNQALATLGKDDDSYEAGGLRDEAEVIKSLLEDGFEATLKTFLAEDSRLYGQATDAAGWLVLAKRRLDRLG